MSSIKTEPASRQTHRLREGESISKTDAPRTSGPGDGAPDEPPRPFDGATIMIVDDEPTTIRVVQRYLMDEGHMRFVTTSDPGQAMSMVTWERPDLLLLDIMMPLVNGLEILEAIRKDPEVASTPVIILTAGTDRATRLEALRRGATDFLQKPVDPSELAVRVRNNLMVKAHQDHLKDHSRTLEAAVRARTAELENSRRDIIRCLARAAEFRDDDTGRHVLRVGQYARLIGAELGFDEVDLDILEQAAQLHDVGKIGIPDEILLKPARLAPEEFEQMSWHCNYGKRILETNGLLAQEHVEIGATILDSGNSPVLKMATSIALTHHERWDGTGYPLGLAGEDIPLEGRITAVADVFDALCSKRPYKSAFPLENCFKILEDGRSSHFDPSVLDAFLRRREEVVQVQIVYADVDRFRACELR
ncbi:MAG: HD domain-containing phosphohydrolase [Isosphaerales bacterium]